MSAATAVASASSSESFPNVIAEAMACASCCVATDVGDSAFIIGNSGIVVPAGDPVALAQGILSVLDMSAAMRSAMGHEARERVTRLFNLSDTIIRYEQLYSELS
jgi:glycosyltransferase involved in cell wall biosynthesis